MSIEDRIKESLRDRADSVSALPEPAWDRLSLRLEHDRSQPARRVATVAAALVLGLGAVALLLIAFGGNRASRPQAAVESGYGISFVVPEGWHARLEYPQGTTGPSLEAADFPLPPTGADTIPPAVRSHGIIIQMRELVYACGCSDFTKVSGPIELQANLIDHEPAGSPKYSTAAMAIRVNGRFFNVSVAFGTGRVSPAQMAQANAVLGRIQIKSGVVPTPRGQQGSLPPSFPVVPGWWQASMPTVNMHPGFNVPTTYVSNVGFKAGDFGAAGPLSEEPTRTVDTLPSSGIVIVAWIDNPPEGERAGFQVKYPNGRYPPRALPLKLSEMTSGPAYKGTAYSAAATIGRTAVGVSVYFGSLHPSAATMHEAQQMLSGMQLPLRA